MLPWTALRIDSRHATRLVFDMSVYALQSVFTESLFTPTPDGGGRPQALAFPPVPYLSYLAFTHEPSRLEQLHLDHQSLVEQSCYIMVSCSSTSVCLPVARVPSLRYRRYSSSQSVLGFMILSGFRCLPIRVSLVLPEVAYQYPYCIKHNRFRHSSSLSLLEILDRCFTCPE